MEKYFLGIDIGTTATKGILLHPVRGIVAEAEAPTQLISRKAGWAEENPEEGWQVERFIRVSNVVRPHAESRDVTGSSSRSTGDGMNR